MVELEPQLERKLRDKFARIDAASPPQALINFRPTTARRRHRRLNFIVGAGAIAVVAAGIAAFGLELSGHPHTTPPPSIAAGGTLPKIPVYSPASPIPKLITPTPMPVYGTGFPSSWYTVVPITKHTGSAVLPAFIPGGWVYVQYACIGTGNLKIEFERWRGQREPQAVLEFNPSGQRRDLRCLRPIDRQSGGVARGGEPFGALGDGRCRDRNAADPAEASSVASGCEGAGAVDVRTGGRRAPQFPLPRVHSNPVVVLRSRCYQHRHIQR